MNIEPGKYYHGLALIKLRRCPAFPHGGDIQLLVWRLDEEKAHWHIDHRYRFYAGTDDPWDGSDRKTFHTTSAEIGVEPVESLVNKFVSAIIAGCAETGVPAEAPDWVMMRGDNEVAMQAIQDSGKDWLHMKKLTREEAIAQGYTMPGDPTLAKGGV